MQLAACDCFVFCSDQMPPFWQSAGDFVLRSLFSAGIAAVILGLIGKRWLTAVEAKHARRLEDLRAQYAADLQHSKQLLQAEIDKTFLVTRVHFETEFRALKEVFAVLSEIRLQLPNLRPQMRIERSDGTREEKIDELQKTHGVLSDLHDKLTSVSEKQKPFYSQAIYIQVEECRRILLSELNDVVLATEDEKFKHEWYRIGVENNRRFLEAYDRLSELIRVRISKLAILRSVGE
jgi:hypothetical protein